MKNESMQPSLRSGPGKSRAWPYRRNQIPYDAWGDYYDLTNGDRKPFIDFYCSLVTERVGSLLDLGCGTGTVTLAVAECMRMARGNRHARVVGVDQSKSMLDHARRLSTEIEWIHGDMCAPNVDGHFDLIISCFNTLQLVGSDAELLQALHAARRLLRPGGIFAFDIYQPNLLYLADPPKDRLARSVVTSNGTRLEVREDASYDSRQKLLTVDWRLFRVDDKGKTQIESMRLPLRQLFADHMQRLLEQAGYIVRERYGDFDKSEFTPASKKQVIVCTIAGAEPIHPDRTDNG